MMCGVVFRALVVTGLLGMAGCAANKVEVVDDLGLALDVASTAEGAYAASPHADQKALVELGHLLVAAQVAVATFQSSAAPVDEAAARAAIAALASCVASAGATL